MAIADRVAVAAKLIDVIASRRSVAPISGVASLTQDTARASRVVGTGLAINVFIKLTNTRSA